MSQKNDDTLMVNDWASEDAISTMEWSPGSPGSYLPLSREHESLSKPTHQNEPPFGHLNTPIAGEATIPLSGTGVTQTRAPGPLGQFQKHFTKPLVPFLTMVYLRAESILQAARSVHVFHMQSLYIARQALRLVILLNDLVDPEEGPDDTQQAERIDLEDDLIELLEAMEEWGADGEEGGSVDREDHLLRIQHQYTQMFKERFYFHDVRDYANDTIYQKLLAYDEGTIEKRRRCQIASNIIQVDYWIRHEEHYFEDQEEPEATPEIRTASSPILGSIYDVVSDASAAHIEAVGVSSLGRSMISIDESNSRMKTYSEVVQTPEHWQESSTTTPNHRGNPLADGVSPLAQPNPPPHLSVVATTIQGVQGTRNACPDSHLKLTSIGGSAAHSKCPTPRPRSRAPPPFTGTVYLAVSAPSPSSFPDPRPNGTWIPLVIIPSQLSNRLPSHTSPVPGASNSSLLSNSILLSVNTRWARFHVPNDVFLNLVDPVRHKLYHQIRQESWFINQTQERPITSDEASRIPGSLPGESVLLAFYDRVPDAQSDRTMMRCTICMQTNQDAHLYPQPDMARVHMRHHFELTTRPPQSDEKVPLDDTEQYRLSLPTGYVEPRYVSPETIEVNVYPLSAPTPAYGGNDHPTQYDYSLENRTRSWGEPMSACTHDEAMSHSYLPTLPSYSNTVHRSSGATVTPPYYDSSMTMMFDQIPDPLLSPHISPHMYFPAYANYAQAAPATTHATGVGNITAGAFASSGERYFYALQQSATWDSRMRPSTATIATRAHRVISSTLDDDHLVASSSAFAGTYALKLRAEHNPDEAQTNPSLHPTPCPPASGLNAQKLLKRVLGPSPRLKNEALIQLILLILHAPFYRMHEMEPTGDSEEGGALLKQIQSIPDCPLGAFDASSNSIFTLFVSQPKFRCLICGSLKQSTPRAIGCVRSHLNHRPFSCLGEDGCKSCPKGQIIKRFFTASLLQSHCRKQTRSTKCTYCCQTFTSNIKRHWEAKHKHTPFPFEDFPNYVPE